MRLQLHTVVRLNFRNIVRRHPIYCTLVNQRPPLCKPQALRRKLAFPVGGLSKTTDTVCEFPLAAVLITFAATAVAIGLLATVVLILVVVGFKRKLKTIASTSSQGDGNSYYMQPVKAGL